MAIREEKKLKWFFRQTATAMVAAPLILSASFADAANDNKPAPDFHVTQQALLSSTALSSIDMAPVIAAENSMNGRHLTVSRTTIEAPEPSATSSHVLKAGMTPLAAGISMGPIGFAAPWALLGLAALPLLWRLMKTTPPKPRQEKFPPMHIISRISSQDKTPHQMPLWHRQMRLAMAAAVVIGLAQPELNPDAAFEGEGPVMLVIDNGWASARNWPDRIKEMDRLIDRAAEENRPVMLLPTAPSKDGSPVSLIGPLDPEEARKKMTDLSPQSWPVDREAARGVISSLQSTGNSPVIWISNSIDDGHADTMVNTLADYGHLTIIEDESHNMVRLLRPPEISGDQMTVTVERPEAGMENSMSVTASDEKGYPLAETTVVFGAGETKATATLDMPLELRNRMTRLAIDGESSAGATILLDEHWRRRPVGLIDSSAGMEKNASPLLDESHYLEKALAPHSSYREDSVQDLMDDGVSVMVMTDDVTLSRQEREKVKEWVAQGGTLLRFAGPRLAAEGQDDDLLPVRLRPDIRHIGNRLAGQEKGGLASFSEDSPFYGIKIPDDIKVNMTVTAEPGFETTENTWARLNDGTPFVTARQEGDGWIVLVHSTGDAGWSNLPLSGLFVDMMKAVVAHSQGEAGIDAKDDISLPPYKSLNGQGRLVDPPPSARALTGKDIQGGDVSAAHPPGYYGTASARYAHNLAAGVPTLKPLPDELPADVVKAPYRQDDQEQGFMGPLLTGAFAIFLIDWLLRMGQQGRLPSFGRSREKEQKQSPAGKAPSAKNGPAGP